MNASRRAAPLVPDGRKSLRIGSERLPMYKDGSGVQYVRGITGEFIRKDVAKLVHKQKFAVAPEILAVAKEVMGGVDPFTLTDDERIERMQKFFSESLPLVQEYDRRTPEPVRTGRPKKAPPHLVLVKESAR